MSEVSSLKLKLNAMEKDRLDFDRFRDSEVCGLISKMHTQTHSFMLSATSEGVVLYCQCQSSCVVKINKQTIKSATLTHVWELHQL